MTEHFQGLLLGRNQPTTDNCFLPLLPGFWSVAFPGAALFRIVSYFCRMVVVVPLFIAAGGSVFQRGCFPSPLMKCPPRSALQIHNPNSKLHPSTA